MIRNLLVKCVGASLATVTAIGLSSSGASAWGGNSISETGPGSVNIIATSSSNYSSYDNYGSRSYGSMGVYRMMPQCEYASWFPCGQYQNNSYDQKSYYHTASYQQSPCQYSNHRSGQYY